LLASPRKATWDPLTHPWIHIFGVSLPSYGALITIAVPLCHGVASVLGKRTPVGSDHATTAYPGA
jgi:hypothetical protein